MEHKLSREIQFDEVVHYENTIIHKLILDMKFRNITEFNL